MVTVYTSPDKVTAVLGGDVDDGDDLSPYIDGAVQLVTDLCTKSGYTDDKLTTITTWLAAHLYVINRPRVASEGISPGPSQRFEPVTTGFGLANTKYGQQAIMFDTAGNLASWNSLAAKGPGPRVAVHWLGKRGVRWW